MVGLCRYQVAAISVSHHDSLKAYKLCKVLLNRAHKLIDSAFKINVH